MTCHECGRQPGEANCRYLTGCPRLADLYAPRTPEWEFIRDDDGEAEAAASQHQEGQ